LSYKATPPPNLQCREFEKRQLKMRFSRKVLDQFFILKNTT
jgi:hypothetical protein